jgi:hypothetical protein
MALNGHREGINECPLLDAKRTSDFVKHARFVTSTKLVLMMGPTDLLKVVLRGF